MLRTRNHELRPLLSETRRRQVDKSSRNSTSDSKRRSPELAAKPVLARLPDVSAELLRQRPAAGRVGYRFDPPEAPEQASSVPLRNELVYAPQTTRQMQPHVFERGRTTERQARSRHRESPVLPRTNPFALPRRRMVDSFAPVLRFLTLVALFTAAATWIQVIRQNNSAAHQPAEPRGTTAQERSEPAGKTAERPNSKMPTAVGPVNGTPEAGTRVGRVRETNDFAALRGDILPVAPAADEINFTLPSLVGANGSELPRVQTTEAPAVEIALGGPTGSGDAPARLEGESPEVATLPGFIIEKPSR